MCNVLDNFKVLSTNKNTLEHIWLELDNGICKYIVGALYRHPNQNINDFNDILDARLSEISKSHVPCLIVGDINIDLCKYSFHSPTTQYVDNLLVNNFRPVIVMPTRITEQSKTIIDHIYYFEGNNCPRNLNVMSGNLWCDISDHLPNYVIVSNPKKNKSSSERPLTRIYSHKNIKTFQHLISSTVWDDIYNCQDVDESYKVFEAKLKTCYDESFPLIRVSRRCARNKRWITPGIIVCSKKK